MGHSLGVVVALLAILSRYSCGGRELRPSDHGLAAYQEESSPPAQNDGDAQQMISFFGTTTTPSSPAVQLPEAKNISDTWLSAHADDAGRSNDGGRDHVRLGFLAASAVCGLTGVVLLAVSGVVFIFRLQKQKQKLEADETITSTSAQTSNEPRDDSHALSANELK